MKTQLANSKRLPILMILLGLFAGLPLLSNAHAAATRITIVNNSSRAIRHVYLSADNQDNWGADQLNGSIPPGGGSFTLEAASCAGAGVVIAEDQNGCFLYHVVTCNENVTWTITNDAVPDCGN